MMLEMAHQGRNSPQPPATPISTDFTFIDHPSFIYHRSPRSHLLSLPEWLSSMAPSRPCCGKGMPLIDPGRLPQGLPGLEAARRTLLHFVSVKARPCGSLLQRPDCGFEWVRGAVMPAKMLLNGKPPSRVGSLSRVEEKEPVLSDDVLNGRTESAEGGFMQLKM